MKKEIPESQYELFIKGTNDSDTRAHVSVTVKYTTKFIAKMSVHPKYGMYLIATNTVKVNLSIFIGIRIKTSTITENAIGLQL